MVYGLALILKLHSRCEHYNYLGNHDHLVNYDISNGLYDLDYLEALFGNDTERINFIEECAKAGGYGPLSCCSFVSNFSAIKVDCRMSHSHILGVRNG